MCTIFGSVSALFIYNYTPLAMIDITETSIGRKVYSFFNGKYYFDIVYNQYIISKGLSFGYNISK